MESKPPAWIIRCACEALLVVHPGGSSEETLQEAKPRLEASLRRHQIDAPLHLIRGEPGETFPCPECGREHAVPLPDGSDPGDRWVGPPFRRVDEGGSDETES